MSEKTESRYFRCYRYGRTEIYFSSGKTIRGLKVVTLAASPRSAGKDI